eukprot:gene15275-10922_t
MLSKLAKKTVTVQENVGNQTIAKQVEIRSLPEPQAFRKKTISLLSPDAVFYDGETRGEAAVTMLGEVKGRGSGDFLDDEVGQLIRGITRLLHCQMFRATLIGFLTASCSRGVFDNVTGTSPSTPPAFSTGPTAGRYAFVGRYVLPTPMTPSLFHPQKLFGLMVADPADIGFTPLVLPGYTVDSLLGKGAFSAVYKAIEDAASATAPPALTVEIHPPQLPPTLAVHNVLGDGNCFFHAIADQLRRLGVRDASRSLFTHELLRQLTLSAIGTLPRLRAFITEDELLDLARVGFCVSMRRATRTKVTETASTRALRIIYNGHDHYDSVVPAAGGASSSRKRPREAEETTNNDRDLDVGPALLVTAVGRPVLPVKGGVRACVSDYLHLLTALEHAHGRGICHRDVKPQNIFIDDRGVVFLNDWGSAAETGKLTPWTGTEYVYTPRDGAHRPLPAEDLVAFVRTIFLLYTGLSPSALAERCMAYSEFWREALRLANLCDYDALRSFINKF